MDRAIDLKCTVVGRVEITGSEMQLILDRDRITLPFGISGQDINPPWPADIYTNQQWSVIPKIDSQGQIVSLKGWQYQAVDSTLPPECWQFTGRIQQADCDA